MKEVLNHRGGRESSGKRMAGWMQSENLILKRQYQLLFIDPLSEVDPSQ